MIKKIAFSLLILSVSVSAFACIEEGTEFGAEVIIVEPGVTWDLDLLKKSIKTKNTKIHFGGQDAMAYVSHYDKRVAVIVAEEVNGGVAGLDVSIQIPYKRNMIPIDGRRLVEAVNVKADKFDFGSAMITELEWMKNAGILKGITEEQIEDISTNTTRGRSGYNSRIVFGNLEGLDLPESFSATFGATKRSIKLESTTKGCGRGIDQNALLELINK